MSETLDYKGIFPSNDNKPDDRKRYVVVTETALLVLQPIGQRNLCRLRGWQCLYFLDKVTRDVGDKNTLRMEFQGKPSSVVWHLRFSNADNFLPRLIDRMRHIGCKEER